MFNFSPIVDRALSNKVSFLTIFFLVFTGTYAVLYAVDIYPEPVTSKASEIVTKPTDTDFTAMATATLETNTNTATATENADLSEMELGSDTLPQSITIDALDRTVTVLNPSSKSVAALDAALLKGAIRHPDSATFGAEGNMFILGHSSYLPTVHNRNFQAFNGIQNLKWGDTLRLRSNSAEFTYKVEKVYKAKASAVTVPVAGKRKTLTIATCNSFGSTDDRYIVEATLIKTSTL